MARLMVVIPDEVNEAMRSVIPAKKGAIGEFVTDAIVEKLKRMGAFDGGKNEDAQETKPKGRRKGRKSKKSE